MGWSNSMVMKAVNSRLLFTIYCAFRLSVSDHDMRAENIRTPLPPIATGSEAVTEIFDVKSIRLLQPASFAPLRKYFSVRQQRNIDKYLRALNELTITRNRIALQAGVKEKWW